MKQIIGFVTQCFNKYVYVVVNNTNTHCVVKFIKSKKWEFTKKQSIGAAVYLESAKTVCHFTKEK